jgi:pyruvate dehydrogenase E2 component (dihydrolipoamide acetyltransferase)
MPEIAANTEEATLTEWPVAENQPFTAGVVIATVETAKAAVDIEAEADGAIIKTLVTPGTDVNVGDAIALIAAPGEKVDDIDAVLAKLGIGTAKNTSDAVAVAAVVPDASSEPEVQRPASDDRLPEPTPAPAATNGQQARVFASPLARRMARDAGIDFDSLTGTGPGGRIVRRDVEQAIARQKASTPAATSDPGAAASLEVASRTVQQARSTTAPASPGTYTDVPHSKLRKVVAQRLTESKRNIPHFYLRGTAEVDRLLTLRADLNAVSPVKISVNDLVVKAVAQAHVSVAGLNVIWTENGMREFDSVDLGIAVATDNGLVTPVLRAVERMSISSVATATRDFAARAKQGGLKQAELEGGCATITNLGMYGTEEFGAIINPPQSSILAVGAARREPVVTAKGRVRSATTMRVTLSVDHRAIDGALAAEWMRAFLAILEQPLQILA